MDPGAGSDAPERLDRTSKILHAGDKAGQPFAYPEVAHMTDPTDAKRGKVPLREFLEDFRSAMSDQELKAKYDLSAQAFVSLIKALLAKELVSPDDLAMRKEMAVQRDLARESQFLAGLYICENCSHLSPTPFQRCPACGAVPGENSLTKEEADPVTPTGRHIYVGTSSMAGGHKEVLVDEEPEAVEVVEVISQDTRSSRANATDGTEAAEREPTEKRSGLKSVRSFLTKTFKKS